MLRLFALKNSAFDDGEIFQAYLPLTDGDRMERVKSLVGARAKSQSLSAGIILPLALNKCGFGGEVRIERGEWGKPRLISPEGVYFNLSHSGEYTVIALSDSEVGCDIQMIKPINLSLARRYFHPKESAAIGDCEPSDGCGPCGDCGPCGGDKCECGDGAKTELFFRFWCAKESFIKATGEGLKRPLNSFYVDLPQGEVISADGGPTPWCVMESGEIAGYRIAICTRRPQPFTVERIDI